MSGPREGAGPATAIVAQSACHAESVKTPELGLRIAEVQQWRTCRTI
jgi:hypothetical protein